MQHIWFLFSRGLTMPSRINILIGVMGYLSSPLWLLFLVFSPILFIGGRVPVQNSFLFVCSMLLLFIPKVLAAQRMIASPPQNSTGGAGKIILSTLGETVFSMILAPILMLFYTQFVWSSFFGGFAGWGRQKRSDDEGPSWRECIVVHAAHTLLAIAACGLVGWLLPAMLPWLLLVLIGPMVSIPFSHLMASNKLGQLARRHGWFLIPEETEPPPELKAMAEPDASLTDPAAPDGLGEDFGLARTVLDPRLNALHISLLRERPQIPLHTHERLTSLCDKLLRNGPSVLQIREKKLLLWDADAMLALHQKLWASPAVRWHEWWQVAFRSYVKSLPETI
jgi:membrane glycosyltransferase